MNRLFTANELATILRVHPKTIYRLAKAGQITSYKVGRLIRFEMPTSERNKTNGTETNTER